MEKTIPLTQKKYDELVAKLNQCETQGRADVSEAIRLAKEFGDLSENAEYSAAKNAQEKLEIEIANLTQIISKAYPIDVTLLSTKTVSIGNIVKLYDMEFEEECTYQIVSSYESCVDENKISDNSPIGKALLGKKKGDIVKVIVPSGSPLEMEILDITK